jgi:hypothetical protein
LSAVIVPIGEGFHPSLFVSLSSKGKTNVDGRPILGKNEERKPTDTKKRYFIYRPKIAYNRISQ